VEQGEEAYQFAHDVIREVVEADLGAARRTALAATMSVGNPGSQGQAQPGMAGAATREVHAVEGLEEVRELLQPHAVGALLVPLFPRHLLAPRADHQWRDGGRATASHSCLVYVPYARLDTLD
jgi:hypothetical protein